MNQPHDALMLPPHSVEAEQSVIGAILLAGHDALDRIEGVITDLRDSGEVEQDADIVAMLHREELHNHALEWKGLAELIIRKNRNGRLGDVVLQYRGEHMRFEQYTGRSPRAEHATRRPTEKAAEGYRKANRLHGTMRELDNEGLQGIADAKEKNPMATEAKPLGRAADNLSKINADMREVRRSDATPEEKRRRLDELTVERNALLKSAVLEAKGQKP